ncbi:hypothetical protein QRD02_13590 [Aequorivita sp. SDUM287046]|uniref:Lipoprotein n=1 Tax=Aequorivita aurantiaca TaxID=3053356 RepID=A0ABT8DJ53_9FLAO|nr:hypothetical protein [Aequorivita aurantiaca]MDN3725416.1 hypothetical protein [Aequorivita aurantiaca]
MKHIALLLFALVLIATSCSSSKSIKFSKKSDEIVKTDSLKNFLAANKNPKVVLRVNEASYTVTENENIDYLYNAIENQLLASKFVVRDRQLFNQIIGNKDNNIDYEVLKNKSDTDLIIELTKLDPKIIYSTNKYYNKNNEEKIEQSYVHQYYGASVEFKVILIKTNEFAGVYKFNYTPCTAGCIIKKSMKELTKERREREKNGPQGYEGVEKDELEIFIKEATRQLVAEMRS